MVNMPNFKDGFSDVKIITMKSNFSQPKYQIRPVLYYCSHFSIIAD